MDNDNVLDELGQFWSKFSRTHLGFSRFMQQVGRKELVPGTVIQVDVMFPGEDVVSGEIELTAQDVELLRSMDKLH